MPSMVPSPSTSEAVDIKRQLAVPSKGFGCAAGAWAHIGAWARAVVDDTDTAEVEWLTAWAGVADSTVPTVADTARAIKVFFTRFPHGSGSAVRTFTGGDA